MAVQQVEEVPADGVVVGFDVDAVAVMHEVMPVEQHGAKRGHEAVGYVERSPVRVGLRLGLERCEHGDSDAENVHGMSAGRNLLEGELHLLRKAAQAAEMLLVVIELLGGGQLAVEEEIGDLFEGAVRGESKDVVAAIVQIIAIATDSAERCVARGNAGKSYGFLRLECVR